MPVALIMHWTRKDSDTGTVVAKHCCNSLLNTTVKVGRNQTDIRPQKNGLTCKPSFAGQLFQLDFILFQVF